MQIVKHSCSLWKSHILCWIDVLRLIDWTALHCVSALDLTQSGFPISEHLRWFTDLLFTQGRSSPRSLLIFLQCWNSKTFKIHVLSFFVKRCLSVEAVTQFMCSYWLTKKQFHWSRPAVKKINFNGGKHQKTVTGRRNVFSLRAHFRRVPKASLCSAP